MAAIYKFCNSYCFQLVWSAFFLRLEEYASSIRFCCSVYSSCVASLYADITASTFSFETAIPDWRVALNLSVLKPFPKTAPKSSTAATEHCWCGSETKVFDNVRLTALFLLMLQPWPCAEHSRTRVGLKKEFLRVWLRHQEQLDCAWIVTSTKSLFKPCESQKPYDDFVQLVFSVSISLPDVFGFLIRGRLSRTFAVGVNVLVSTIFFLLRVRLSGVSINMFLFKK